MQIVMSRTLIVLMLGLTTIACTSRGFWTGAGIAGAAAAGAAAIYYARGDLEADLEYEIEEVHKASLAELKERGYDINREYVGATEGEIEAEKIVAEGDEEDLTIKTNRLTSERTHISVRVGVFGDEAQSRAILDGILKRLNQ